MAEANDILWNEILEREGQVFTTHKGREFTYHIKRPKGGETSGEIVIDRTAVVITRSTLLLAYHGALEVQQKKGFVDGPRKLGAYGDLYLYPVFLAIGICGKQKGDPVRDLAAEAQAFHATEQEKERLNNHTPEKGPRQIRRCEKCGYATEEDFMYCPKCGNRLL